MNRGDAYRHLLGILKRFDDSYKKFGKDDLNEQNISDFEIKIIHQITGGSVKKYSGRKNQCIVAHITSEDNEKHYLCSVFKEYFNLGSISDKQEFMRRLNKEKSEYARNDRQGWQWLLEYDENDTPVKILGLHIFGGNCNEKIFWVNDRSDSEIDIFRFICPVWQGILIILYSPSRRLLTAPIIRECRQDYQVRAGDGN